MVFFLLLSIILMTLDHRQNHLEKLRAALSVVVYPLQLIVDLPRTPIKWVSETVTPRSELEEELKKLQTQQLLLRAQLHKMVSLEAENRRLRQLSQAAQRLSDDMIIAEIMSVDLDPFSRKVIINKGSNHDAFNGQAILDADGVLGQILHAGLFNSEVMLITDPSHAVPVQVNRNGLRALAVGTGSSEEMNIPYIPNNADIQTGDLLITSGLGGKFPSGYPVARITSIEIDQNEPYARVTAKPAAQMDRSREILMVKPAAKIKQHEAVIGESKQP
ncbi:MAG: rod shape-determining protein MreC [Gammaproteobacteria bacterium]|nr:rod shape-determining protein MreC [Gammaproteobacteria bacterium]